MTILSRKAVKLPPLRKKTVDVSELGGEVVLQALMLSDSLRISRIKDGHERVKEILAVGVLADDGKPLWTAPEWDQWGSVNENRLVCIDLAAQIFELSEAKKISPQTSDSP